MNLSILFLVVAIYLHILPTQTLTISGYGIKDLEGNDSVSFQKEADWWNVTSNLSSAKITQTTTTLKWILGGPDILGPGDSLNLRSGFVRTYTNLPPHSFVGISVEFWYFDNLGRLGNFSGFSLEVFGHDSSIRGPSLRLDTDFTTKEGGTTNQNDLGRDHTKFGFLSNASELTLIMQNLSNPTIHFQSFGFRELHIHLSNYSGSVPDMCHISEDVNPLQWDQCSCSINQAKDSSGSCVSCAANCDICFGPADDQCLACSSGAYWDGSKCNTCDISCQTCTGTTSNDCPSCKYGFYNYGNNTCMASCELPFVVEQIGIELFCKRKCDPSQFYFPSNSSCLDKCDFPLIHAPDENGIEYCLNPCEGTNKYLYSNGSCYDSCKPPIIPRFDPYIKFCLNPCSAISYLFSNGSCISSCPAPLLSRSEPGINYCWSPCPSKSYFLFNNGSCGAICPSPLISRSESGVKYCFTPCSSVNDFVYDNKSCGTSCSFPLLSRTEPLVANYCLNPCLSTSKKFLFPNGSCFAECRWPLRNRSEPGVKYCYSPCSSPSDYIYPSGACENKCPFPLMSRDEPDFKFCFTPCSSTKYLYNDQSCHDSCEPPLIRRFESDSGIKYCDTPCSQDEYAYPDGSCRSGCEYPYKAMSNPSYRVCSISADETLISQAHSLARGTDVANAVCGIGGLLTGFVTPSDPTSMLMWSLLKMLQFTKYMEVNFPEQMALIFTQQGGMSSLGSNDLWTFRFSKSFLENYREQLIVFAVLIPLSAASSFLPSFLKNSKYIKICRNLKSSLQWNVVIMFFCGSYGDLLLYSAIELQAFSFETGGDAVSFAICLFMVIIAAYIPLKVLYVINTVRKAKTHPPDIGKSWAKNKVLFESYKSDDAIQQIFLFVYLVRVALFDVIIGYIFKSPLTQALLINFLNFGMLAYLVLKAPIKNRFCFAQHVLIESLLFVYNLCLLVLVIMDLAGVEVESTRAFFGGIMIVILIVGPMATAFLIVFKLSLRLSALYNQFQAERDTGKVINNPFRLKKVQSHGNDETLSLSFETLNFNGINAEGYYIPTKRTLKKNKSKPQGESSSNIRLEKSFVENLIVQIYGEKESNLERRKFNVFKNDDYLPD